MMFFPDEFLDLDPINIGNSFWKDLEKHQILTHGKVLP